MTDTPPSPIINISYLTFTVNTAEDKAAARFRERFGVEPEYIFDFKNLLWVGPIPQPANGKEA